MPAQSVTTRKITTAAGVFAPGHLGELTQVIDHELVDAVIEQTRTRQKRLRLLPTRVVVYFVLGLALFESCSYLRVWDKLVAGLAGLPLARPSKAALVWARKRVGPAPFRVLFETLAAPAGRPQMPGVCWRGWRVVVVDGTTMRVPDHADTRSRYRKRGGAVRSFGYPLLRLVVLVEAGTRAVLGAGFGPERHGETRYAAGLLACLNDSMLLLADAGYDAVSFIRDAHQHAGALLVRSSAARVPVIWKQLPDGSYLSLLDRGRLQVRIIEVRVKVRYADGTTRTETWRLLTTLCDHRRFPARALVALYHQRWQVETTYLSIKSTILDGRVLRSHHPADIDQEVWALLALYQAIIHLSCDAVATTPGLDARQASFTTACETARDQVVSAANITPPPKISLISTIGQAVLTELIPQREPRVKARSRKNPTSVYQINNGKHPQTTQTYTISFTVQILEEGLTARPRL